MIDLPSPICTYFSNRSAALIVYAIWKKEEELTCSGSLLSLSRLETNFPNKQEKSIWSG